MESATKPIVVSFRLYPSRDSQLISSLEHLIETAEMGWAQRGELAKQILDMFSLAAAQHPAINKEAGRQQAANAIAPIPSQPRAIAQTTTKSPQQKQETDWAIDFEAL